MDAGAGLIIMALLGAMLCLRRRRCVERPRWADLADDCMRSGARADGYSDAEMHAYDQAHAEELTDSMRGV